jgi:hypothetical protein
MQKVFKLLWKIQKKKQSYRILLMRQKVLDCLFRQNQISKKPSSATVPLKAEA